MISVPPSLFLHIFTYQSYLSTSHYLFYTLHLSLSLSLSLSLYPFLSLSLSLSLPLSVYSFVLFDASPQSIYAVFFFSFIFLSLCVSVSVCLSVSLYYLSPIWFYTSPLFSKSISIALFIYLFIYLFIILYSSFRAHSVGAVEYTDCISAEE